MSLSEQQKQGLLTGQEKQLLLALVGRVANAEIGLKISKEYSAVLKSIIDENSNNSVGVLENQVFG